MRSAFLKNQSLNGSAYVKAICDIFDNAEKSIDIIMFDWRWPDNDPGAPMSQINQAIIRARRRGIIVRAYTNHSPLVDKLNNLGIVAKCHAPANLLHIKQVIVDNELLITGSHNFTNSAMRSNIESSIAVIDSELVAQKRVLFENLWSL